MQQIERAIPSRQSAWKTVGLQPHQQFAYYREAICQAFMNLTPEPTAAAGFAASVEHVPLGDAAINRVSFPEHVVRRSAADIAASDRSCFYLNLKLAGRCRIRQDGREINLSPGQVGIFDSDRQFALLTIVVRSCRSPRSGCRQTCCASGCRHHLTSPLAAFRTIRSSATSSWRQRARWPMGRYA
jgi:hypothetical protein